MANYNKVILMGHLTRDPQTSNLPSGTPVTEFALAVNRRWNDAQDNAREEVLFIDCTSFGKQAETLGKYLSKGKPIHVEGHLKLDSWEAQDGSKRSKIRIIVNQYQFVDSGRTQTESIPASTGAMPAAGPVAASAAPTAHARPTARKRDTKAVPATQPDAAPAHEEIPI